MKTKPSAPAPGSSLTLDAKTIAAVAALLTALAGGVELRVQVGMLASRLDRIEAELRARADRYLAYDEGPRP